MNTNGYLLYELPNQSSVNIIPTSITDVNVVFDRWEATWRKDFLTSKLESIANSKNQEIPEWMLDKVSTEKSTWSPDDKKFFIINKDVNDPNKATIVAYNSESPLPIGEKRLYDPIEITDVKNTIIQWYSDSYHFILLEKAPNSDSDRLYTISIVRIDGTNKTTIYTGELSTNQAYPTPSGDKIIVLTSLKDNSQTNLYAISIR